MAHHGPSLSACANCGYAFPPDAPAEFCPQCGQQNHEINISFGHLIEETLEGLFHFDGKVFQTIKLLLFRPGVLTRRFLAGHRVPYVPPVRLYVFLSFVFFLLLAALSKPEQGGERKVQELANEMAQPTTKQRQLVEQTIRDMAAATPAQRDSLRRLLRDSLQQAKGKGGHIGLSYSAPGDSVRGAKQDNLRFSFGGLDFGLEEEDIRKLPSHPSNAQLDSVIRSKGSTPGFWSRMALKRTLRWRDVTTEDALHQVVRGLSILVFLIMPLAALLLKGVYFRQRRYYIAHLIFTVHVHCFLLVYYTVLLLLTQLSFFEWLEEYAVLVPAVYFVVALRNFYQQGWLKTTLKSLLLAVSYALTLGFAAVLVTVAGLFLF